MGKETAVIVIDVQNMFFSGAKPAHRAAEVIDGINRLTAAARRSEAPVFIVQHESDANGPLARESDAWRLPSSLVREAGDAPIHKTVGDSFQGTPLEQRLRERGIESVVLCGYATEFCVNATARRAELLGFRTVVAADLHTTADKPHLDAAKIVEHQNFVWTHSSMSGNGVSVLPSAEILQKEFA
ncbi:cysteine hydrolase family protein [Caballeronia sp. GAFFF1]|uniref:cysteine hydrolase family protein n=1 Tax=Caballeronia sp. GAFFF1 TaxID=2921779 RepID=UPI002027CADE|nr:cysteine hydrolase family protein [Caballeronia sp. GAFFF1]